VIRDEEDFIRHVEYIHYNPVKHNLVASPKDREYSSFHCYRKKELYGQNRSANQEIVFQGAVGHE
jgi:putative transposase